MSPTKRVKRVSSIRTPRGMVLHLSPLPLAGEGGERSEPGKGPELHLLVRVDDRLPVGADLLQPIGGQSFADLLEAARERIARGLYLHALGLELVRSEER